MKFFSIQLALVTCLLGFASNAATPQIVNGNSAPGDSLKKMKSEVSFYDTSAIFIKSWKENVTFAYDVDKYEQGAKVCFIDSVSGYAFPIEKETTSGFGRRHGRQHKGIDIPLKTGEPVMAAFDGKVRYATYNGGGFGNLIIIRHKNGLETYYAHLSRIKVKVNQIVKAGQVIGLGGSTGRSYSPHLHFEMRYHDIAFDPANVFDTENYCLRNEVAEVKDLVTQKSSYGRPRQIVPPGDGTLYAIQSGDTLSKIAARNGTTVDKLCALNGMDRNQILQIGQKIRVN